ncbi:nitrous oxide reductase accessory protein NosL [Marinobacterium aestuariivivens]|uniref:Nitrous oxide reductase accessory protein NosL n=1 Tax=Marinobacterium aestuariivivens TaxID=1698799 RepID=A0ABW2A5D6_9GAMM
MKRIRLRHTGFLALAIALLAGCNGSNEPKSVAQQAVAIESRDECHLCGMLIANFPGPKGEAYGRGETEVKKFCSTRDLFAWALDPEYRHRVESIFVHDMAVTPWDHPDDETFIDARSAWYVIDHSRPGAMGPTLASFSRQDDARAFAEQYGGKLIGFDEITLETLSQLTLAVSKSDHQGMQH